MIVDVSSMATVDVVSLWIVDVAMAPYARSSIMPHTVDALAMHSVFFAPSGMIRPTPDANLVAPASCVGATSAVGPSTLQLYGPHGGFVRAHKHRCPKATAPNSVVPDPKEDTH